MKYVTCQVVQETSSREVGRAMLRLEDIGGGLTQLRLEFGIHTTTYVFAERGLAELYSLIGQRLDELDIETAPRLRAVAGE